MALRVWLPLNGDLHNQGLSDVEVTNNNAVVNANGKIGKCYQFGTGTNYLELPASCMTSFTECSVAFWIKILTWQTNYCTFFDAAINSNAWTGYVFGFLRNSTASTCCFTISNGSSASNASYLTPELDLNTWYHITLTYKAGHCCIYINGELYKDYTTTIVPAFNRITKIRVGKAYSGYQSNCLMNDLKIYDHCLLPLEIKKVSQGLVLHYRLSGVGGENLIPNITNWTKEASANFELQEDGYYKISSKATSATRYGIYYDFVFPEPNIYTFSADVRTDYHIGIAPATDFKWTVNTINGNNKKRISYSITTTEENNKCRIYITSTKSYSTYIKNIKLEKGSYPTPWCPNSLDDEYSIMGLDDNIEYDCSGFGNNGTKNNIVWSGDTPRYVGSYEFNGTNSYIKTTDNNWISQYAEEMTINVWAYADDWTKQTKLFSCTESGGFNTEAGASGYIRFSRHVATKAEHTTHTYQYNNNGIKLADLDSGWHMFTFVYNTSGEKIYIDGQLYSQGSYTSYGLHFNTNARLFLGCEAKTANPLAPYFCGKESDFRIYYTALSADDILDLYHLGGSIDSSGTFHTYEYVEGE